MGILTRPISLNYLVRVIKWDKVRVRVRVRNRVRVRVRLRVRVRVRIRVRGLYHLNRKVTTI